jgi:PTS system nitrogen regulatory IIA component
MIKISKYLDPNLVFFLNVNTREEVLNFLIDQLDHQNKLKDRELFRLAIMDRERIVSTGIGMGIAIPHAKLPDYNDFFIAIAILNKGMEWHALDGAPVRLIFLIGGPDDKQNDYLQILSCLTLALKEEDRRRKMLTLNTPEDIIELFREV